MYNIFNCLMSELGLPCKYLLLYERLQNLPAAQATRAESSTRKCMVDDKWTIGLSQQLGVFIYQRSCLTASYKVVNHVEFTDYYQVLLIIFSPILLSRNDIYL